MNKNLLKTTGGQDGRGARAGERTRLIWAAIISVLAMLGGCIGAAPPPSQAHVPQKLVPPDGEQVLATLAAVGVQVYECRAVKDSSRQYEWAFVAPEADLFDRGGMKVGRHYAGPHWEARDGSRVVGAVKEKVQARAGDAVPWLLLAARSAGPEGAFSKVTSIQRVRTLGGNAPQDGCSQATQGASARVPYSADYVLFSR